MSSTHHAGLNGAVAAVLRGERAAAGMTIDELAERSGIPKVSVQRFLSGRRVINFETFEALCHGLGLLPEEVVIQARQRMLKADPELVQRMVAGIADVTPPTSGESVTRKTESS